jgi:hypothetical protein
MMVNCPKCGFSQPEDQYCAKCGVDMVAYKPPPPPMYAQVLGNTFFQVMVLATLVIGVFSFIRHRQTSELAARIAEIESAPTQVIEKHVPVAANPQNPQPPPVAQAASNEVAAATEETHSSTSASTAPLSAMAQPSAALADAGAAINSAPTELRVFFGEVTPSLVADAQSASSSGPYYSGVIPNFGLHLRSGKTSGDWKEVDSSQPQSLKIGKTAPVFRTVSEDISNIPYGFTVKVTASSLDETGAVVHVEVTRVMTDTSTDPQIDEFTIPLPDSFTIPKGGAAFVIGTLPHRLLQAAEEKLYGNLPIFKILKSESYRAGATDFGIFIEPK